MTVLQIYRHRPFSGVKPNSTNKTFTDPCDGVERLCCTSSDEIYRLKNYGILKELPTGGSVIEATSLSMPFRLPYTLKNLPYASWTTEDKIWLNM